MAMYILNSLDKAYIPADAVIYVAGPMSGYPSFNYETFHAVSRRLRELGHTVISPAERVPGEYGPAPEVGAVSPEMHRDYLREGFRKVLDSDVVVLLPGWRESTGANHEYMMASALGMDLYEIESEVLAGVMAG